VEDRVAGYRVAMDEAGLRPMLVHCDFLAAYLRGSEEDERLATAEAALTSDERPTAVVCYEDDETAIIICAAYRLGLRVPEDLSVVTFAADPPETCGILVTTLQVPHWQVGEAAVAALETKVASPSTDLEPELLPFTYCEGSTVAKPPSDQP
jgi:DNA-binding LacI/PurR family transcriptional regulator